MVGHVICQPQKRKRSFTKNVTTLAATACTCGSANVLLELFYSHSACQSCLYPVTNNDCRKLKISETLLKGRGPGVDKRGHQIKWHWQHSKTSPHNQHHIWGLRKTMGEVNDTQKTDYCISWILSFLLPPPFPQLVTSFQILKASSHEIGKIIQVSQLSCFKEVWATGKHAPPPPITWRDVQLYFTQEMKFKWQRCHGNCGGLKNTR